MRRVDLVDVAAERDELAVEAEGVGQIADMARYSCSACIAVQGVYHYNVALSNLSRNGYISCISFCVLPLPICQRDPLPFLFYPGASALALRL